MFALGSERQYSFLRLQPEGGGRVYLEDYSSSSNSNSSSQPTNKGAGALGTETAMLEILAQVRRMLLLRYACLHIVRHSVVVLTCESWSVGQQRDNNRFGALSQAAEDQEVHNNRG